MAWTRVASAGEPGEGEVVGMQAAGRDNGLYRHPLTEDIRVVPVRAETDALYADL
jgi:hypothetical protein